MSAAAKVAAPSAAAGGVNDATQLDEATTARHQLIVRNLQEVLGDAQLRKHLANHKNISLYWGSATTGRPHVGYFVPMQKISDFLHANIRVRCFYNML